MGDAQPICNIVVTGAALEPERHERVLLVPGECFDAVERSRDCTFPRAGAGTGGGR